MLGLHVYGTNAHACQECVDQRISESANDPENNSHPYISSYNALFMLASICDSPTAVDLKKALK